MLGGQTLEELSGSLLKAAGGMRDLRSLLITDAAGIVVCPDGLSN